MGSRKYGLLPRPTEKQEERIGDRLMATLGFTVWNLSQPRKTMQTPGWPDRLYTHPIKRLAVFWEAKRPGGKQRDGQKLFQAEATACGMNYVCGPSEVLTAWCESKGLCRALANGVQVSGDR